MEMETRTGIKRDREIDRQTTDREREREKKNTETEIPRHWQRDG